MFVRTRMYDDGGINVCISVEENDVIYKIIKWNTELL